MDTQLHLLASDEPDPAWRIDDATREAGRRGVALARQALQEAHRARLADHKAEAA